jgi:hypothetical protein
MFNDVMEVDASQYAAMSREMLESGNYLQLFDRGQNYLDKPPLLFWVSAMSFKLFGISNFSYKLPSVLFSLLGSRILRCTNSFFLPGLVYDEPRHSHGYHSGSMYHFCHLAIVHFHG